MNENWPNRNGKRAFLIVAVLFFSIYVLPYYIFMTLLHFYHAPHAKEANSFSLVSY